MIKTKVSKHSCVDRADRIAEILLTVGMGEVIDHKPHEKQATRHYDVTTTGVLLLRADDGTLITAWAMSIAKATALYNGNVPSWLKSAIKTNMKKGLI